MFSFLLTFITLIKLGDALPGNPVISRTLINGVKRYLSATTYNAANVYSVLGSDGEYYTLDAFWHNLKRWMNFLNLLLILTR